MICITCRSVHGSLSPCPESGAQRVSGGEMSAERLAEIREWAKDEAFASQFHRAMCDLLRDRDALAAELAEAEGVEGRCQRGHHKKFTYDLSSASSVGGVGCVACERDELAARVEALEKALRDRGVAPRWCWKHQAYHGEILCEVLAPSPSGGAPPVPEATP